MAVRQFLKQSTETNLPGFKKRQKYGIGSKFTHELEVFTDPINRHRGNGVLSELLVAFGKPELSNRNSH